MRRRRHANELAIVLGLYTLLAAAASWPLLRDFSTRLLGDVSYDQRHSVWLLWHVKEALLGRQPFFTADLLFYPHGVSTLIDGVGPLSGILALPFWPWGGVAAYNGVTLIGLTLSGWCMYLLARYGATTGQVGTSAVPGGLPADGDGPSLLVRRASAFLAGVVFVLFPIHLTGLYGHIEKVFVGLLPLSVLAGLLAYDPARSRWWGCAPGVVLLLALLHNGNQFVFALLAVVLVAVTCAITWSRDARRFAILWPVVRRACAAGALALVIVGPMLATVGRAARDPSMGIASAADSPRYTPDLLQFVVPSLHQATVGRLVYPDDDISTADFTRRSTIPALNGTTQWLGSGIETAATIPLSVVVLVIAAWLGRRTGVGAWILFSGAFVVLAMGPFLRVMGRTTFTLYQLPLVLPYAVLTSGPGFDVMRTPGRFMMIASVGIAILAAWGLARLMARAPRRARLIAALATAVVLVECWPRAWPQQVPPPVPAFYARLAQDPARYAVLDLPGARWRPDLASAYMYYQMTHRKGIAWAYLSRQFLRYPVEGVEGILDDRPPNGPATRARLVQLGYRYVVWHKRAHDLFASRRPDRAADGRVAADRAADGHAADGRASDDRARLSPADAQSNPFIREAFAGAAPIVDDDLVTVYRLEP